MKGVGVHGGSDREDVDRRATVPVSATTTTVSLGQALSASVIPTLVDAHSYEEDSASRSVSLDGEILPATSRKKFPRGLKRLRDRLQVLDDRLRLDVNALKQQISDLQLHSTLRSTRIGVQRPQSVPPAVPVQSNAVETVTEYFGAFQFGWIVPLDSADDNALNRLNRSLASTQTRQPGQQIAAEKDSILSIRQLEDRQKLQRGRHRLLADRQQHFITTALDVPMDMGGSDHGVEGFVTQWKAFSRHHDVSRLELASVRCYGSELEAIVFAHGSRSGYMALVLLQELYPCALDDPVLVTRLVGTLIQYPSRETFYFNSSGRIVRYKAEIDVVKAFSLLH